MTPQEELDLANLRYREIADEFNRIKSERDQIAQVAKDYINATPEQQQNASAEMQNLVNRYNQLGTMRDNIQSEIVGATERIAAAESAVRNVQPVQQSAGQKKRVVKTPNPVPTVSTEDIIYSYNGPVVQGEGITKTYVEQPPVSNVLPEGYTEESVAKYGMIGPESTIDNTPLSQIEPTVGAPGRIVGDFTNNVITNESGRILGYDPTGLGGRTLNELINPFYQESELSLQGPYARTNDSYQSALRTGVMHNEGLSLYNRYRDAYLKNGTRGITDFFRSMGINPYNYTQGVRNIRNRLLQGGVPANRINAFISDWYESYTP